MSDQQSTICDELQPRLAAHALGETPIDAEASAHLAVCPQCQEQFQAYSRIARALPYSAPLIAPPADLRQRVLDAATGAAPRSVERARPRRRWRWRWAPLAFAAALVIGLLGWNMALRAQIETQNQRLIASRDGWDAVTRILNDPAVEVYALSGDSGSGHVWFTPNGTDACVVIEGLPDPGNSVYQIWLTQNGTRISGGTFRPQHGSAWVIVEAPQPVSSYTLMGVTIEPEGGSPQPTSPPVLRGTLSATTPMIEASARR